MGKNTGFVTIASSELEVDRYSGIPGVRIARHRIGWDRSHAMNRPAAVSAWGGSAAVSTVDSRTGSDLLQGHRPWRAGVAPVRTSPGGAAHRPYSGGRP